MPSKTARSELKAKLVLERQLKQTIRGLFGAIARDFRRGLAAGRIINVHDRSGLSLQRLLTAHYRKVSAVFSGEINQALPADVRMSSEEIATLEAKLEETFTEHARTQAIRISLTTQKRMDRVVGDAARAIKDETGAEASREERNALAATKLTSSLVSRISGIACFETQWAAEVSKVLEVAVLVFDEDGIEAKSLQNMTKVWRSQGDSRVRTDFDSNFNHLEADGQEVAANQPFNVSGESLLWPGDMSLGASIGNVAGCRCSAEYNTRSIADLRRVIGRPIIPDPGPGFRQTESPIVVGAEFDLAVDDAISLGIDLPAAN